MAINHVCFWYLTQAEIDKYFKSEGLNELDGNDDFDEILEPHPDLDIEDGNHDLTVWLNAKFGVFLDRYVNLGLASNIIGVDIEHIRSNTLKSLEWMDQVKASTNLYNASNYSRLAENKLPRLEKQLTDVRDSINTIKDKEGLFVVCLNYVKDW